MQAETADAKQEASDTFRIATFCLMLLLLFSIGMILIVQNDWSARFVGLFAIIPIGIIGFGTVMGIASRNREYFAIAYKISRVYSLAWAAIFTLSVAIVLSEISALIFNTHEGLLLTFQAQLKQEHALQGLLIMLALAVVLLAASLAWTNFLRALWFEPMHRKLMSLRIGK